MGEGALRAAYFSRFRWSWSSPVPFSADPSINNVRSELAGLLAAGYVLGARGPNGYLRTVTRIEHDVARPNCDVARPTGWRVTLSVLFIGC